jgi:hypothetical protein
MPEVLRQSGFSIHIYDNDHEPQHVHVLKAGAEVKINLGAIADKTTGAAWVAPTLARVKAMGRADAKRALRIIYEHQASLIAKWGELVDG